MASAMVNVSYIRREGLEKVAFQDTISCLAKKADVPDGSCWPFRGDHETLRFLLKIHDWDKMCSHSHIHMALHLASLPNQWDMAKLYRAALNDVPISREISGACDPAGRTLLQFAAEGLLQVLGSISAEWGILDHALGFDTGGNVVLFLKQLERFLKIRCSTTIYDTSETLLWPVPHYIRMLMIGTIPTIDHCSGWH